MHLPKLEQLTPTVYSAEFTLPETELTWDYESAFSRNRGLINQFEQEHLRKCRVAIIGMGGVGGVHLMTMARIGVGAFHIADPDCFEVANFNRQYGAKVTNLGKNKARVMAEEVRAINPEVQLRVFPEAITKDNLAEFMDGVDIVVDGIDFFAIDIRRIVFNEARRRGLWAVTAGPLGFSTVWLSFSPTGMSFDEYFDIHDDMARIDKLIAFAVGLSPKATHLRYLDLAEVDVQSGKGPSASLACQLCSGVATAEVVKILLGRSPVRPVPWFFQFDAYRQILRKGRLRWGNRHPIQRLKRWWLKRRYAEVSLPGGNDE